MSGARTELGGVLPVVATPFHADGSIDPAGLTAVLRWLIACGVDGVVFPGVASEVEQLKAEERRELVGLVGRTVRGMRPFIVGASAPTAEAVIAHARIGAEAGAAAAMIMAPAAFQGDEEGLVAFYRSIAAAVPIPIMLQNAPPPAGAGFAMDRVARVAAAVPGIRYVKEEAMPCGQRISALMAAAPAHLAGIFGGAGGRYLLDELARGAVGTLPACELAEIHVALMAAWRSGDRARARLLFNRSLPLLSFQAVFRMAMTKEVLRRRGLIAAAHVRAPGPKLDAQDQVELGLMLDEIADLLPALDARAA